MENGQTTEANGAVEQSEARTVEMKQADLNNLIKKESAKAQEKLLKKLGVDDIESVDKSLKQLKELQDSQKSESEKLADELKARETKLSEMEKSLELANVKNAALSKGVKGDRLDKFIKLVFAYDDETTDEKIESALKDFPEFIGQSNTAPANIGGKTGNGSKPTKTDLLQQMRQQAGLNIK